MEEADANARLISTAPRLLELLESTLQSLDDWLCNDTFPDEAHLEMLELEDEIQRAVQEARGER